MTIKKLAEELKVSPQAVYQKLKKNNILVYRLTDKDSKELTEDGELVIRKLFSTDGEEIKPTKQEQVDSLNETVSMLRMEIVKLSDRAEALERENIQLREDKETLRSALEKAQDLHQQTITRLLPAPGQTVSGSGDRLTWRERLTGRRR